MSADFKFVPAETQKDVVPMILVNDMIDYTENRQSK